MKECGCVACQARDGKDIENNRRVARTRGFELEFSHQKIADMKCKHPLPKCSKGERCSMLLPTPGVEEECRCEWCIQEGFYKPNKAVETGCPGHPCIVKAQDAPDYLAHLVRAVLPSGVVHGDFREWRKTARNNTTFDLKTDGSCGFEIATPPWSGDRVVGALGPVLSAVQDGEKAHGILFTDSSCGLHVTFDVSDLKLRQLKQLMLTVVRHQSVLLGTQPKSRWGNRFCKPLPTRPGNNFRRALAIASNTATLIHQTPGLADRFLVLNISRLLNNENLIEFRFGAGTSNIKEVNALSVMLECLIESAISRPRMIVTNDRKKRFYREVIQPFGADPRVQEVWEETLQPRLRDIELPTL